MSDILGEPRVSDVRAKEEALVIHIEKSIDELVVQDPSIAKAHLYLGKAPLSRPRVCSKTYCLIPTL